MDHRWEVRVHCMHGVARKLTTLMQHRAGVHLGLEPTELCLYQFFGILYVHIAHHVQHHIIRAVVRGVIELHIIGCPRFDELLLGGSRIVGQMASDERVACKFVSFQSIRFSFLGR